MIDRNGGLTPRPGGSRSPALLNGRAVSEEGRTADDSDSPSLEFCPSVQEALLGVRLCSYPITTVPISILQFRALNLQIAELGQFFAEVEADRAGRAMAMFGHEYIRNILAVGILNVVIFPIDK